MTSRFLVLLFALLLSCGVGFAQAPTRLASGYRAMKNQNVKKLTMGWVRRARQAATIIAAMSTKDDRTLTSHKEVDQPKLG